MEDNIKLVLRTHLIFLNLLTLIIFGEIREMNMIYYVIGISFLKTENENKINKSCFYRAVVMLVNMVHNSCTPDVGIQNRTEKQNTEMCVVFCFLLLFS
jgi:hypothetical protein